MVFHVFVFPFSSSMRIYIAVILSALQPFYIETLNRYAEQNQPHQMQEEPGRVGPGRRLSVHCRYWGMSNHKEPL